jgi:two-component system, OmpR family, sensor histidine kinase ChvG
MAEGPIAEPREPRSTAAEAPAVSLGGRRSAAESERKLPRSLRPRWFSPLTRRILFVNTVPLFVLVVGVLYLGDYRDSLIGQEIASMTTQGRIIAAALGEAAVSVIDAAGDDDGAVEPTVRGIETTDRLAPDIARQILRRLVEPTRTRARLYDAEGTLVADSWVLSGLGGAVEVESLPPLGTDVEPMTGLANAIYDFVFDWLPRREALKRPPTPYTNDARERDVLDAAMRGEVGQEHWAGPNDDLAFAVGLPIQRFKQVQGALLLTSNGEQVDRNLREVRIDIMVIFLFVLAVTTLVSFYLASTIARPIRRLAIAADRVRRGHGIGSSRPIGKGAAAQPAIPDMRRRGDEIGDLSAALNEMTLALWQRLDAIERFAADVAHELKNPLSSLKSAVETARRIGDRTQLEKLMGIIVDDVGRLDRLIADISDASRLDAELSREEGNPVDVGQMLRALADVQAATGGPGTPRIVLDTRPGDNLTVPGLEDRLGQVLRNVIANAVSFSPPGSTIRVIARRRTAVVQIDVEDQGPGIPDDKLEAIFDRFYSERPSGEKYGTHSGLGLSISRQIVNAHNGTIAAENRRDGAGTVIGARFVIRLPVE